jgi:NAD(P)-dependent dehydrogenase (short-subunit alcohol dehydrogenase family)
VAGQLEGKVALVTGAASGIGRAAAIAFAREGAKVVVSDVDQAGGEATVRTIEDSHGEALWVAADVSDSGQVQELVERTVSAYGRLDCAFNNAGITVTRRTPMVDLTEAEWDRLIGINLKGVWLCLKYEIPEMIKNGGGAIVNTSSTAGLVGSRGLASYVASKHGVAGLTKAAALEHSQDRIRVNAVCPGPIRTALTEGVMAANEGAEERYTSRAPMGRMGMPEEVAEAVVWLCSDAASFVTGHTMAVDGGVVAQ